jgi:adenosylcobyric acid synthase
VRTVGECVRLMSQRAVRPGGLLVAGTTSDAGKSLVTAGLCRWLARRGHRVAPFKAQNMSNNSMVCPDGAEIGRAQWLQALAAGVAPEAAMNPVLLKPGSDLRSHVTLMGKPFGELSSSGWMTDRAILAEAAFGAFDDLRSRFDVVIAEGAGSPTEINLRAHDYVNMGLARHADLPVIVVGDIDRGGVFAAMFGTLALLSAEDQALVAGWVINKFRGDPGLLTSALTDLDAMTGRPVLGTLPWLDDVWIDAEDALAVAAWSADRSSQNGALQVAVVRFPRVSNTTDVDALAAEPGVAVTVTADPDVVRAAHLVVLPGSRATVADLEWLRHRGIAEALLARQREAKPILGICGGFQMLATAIIDDVESRRGRVPGLGLLPTMVTFDKSKHLALSASSWRGDPVESYQIHHGRAALNAEDPRSGLVEPFLDGFRLGTTWGTSGHGLFENDAFRRSWLTEAAGQAGVRWQGAMHAPSFRSLRSDMLDRLADAVEQHLDTDRLLELIERGCGQVPFVPPGVP